MTKLLNIALIQHNTFWENKTANLSDLEEKITLVPNNIDLIVLPEMFNTGFTMNTKMAESMGAVTTKWMKQMAHTSNAVITGSYIVIEDGKYYNRFIAMSKKGILCQYDKINLFPLLAEPTLFTAGEASPSFHVNNFTIRPLICFDLRFPNNSNYTKQNPYDVLLYVANWPSKRNKHWEILLQARAIENQSYVIGCNRVGTDENGLTYIGNSLVFNPKGDVINHSQKENLIFATLNKKPLDEYRKNFPVIDPI